MSFRRKLIRKLMIVVPVAVMVALVIALVAVPAGAINQSPALSSRDETLNSPGPVPKMINYQGYLTDSGGNPINGTSEMTFSIYEVAVGGTPIWTETHSSVTVTDGLFNVLLGSINPILNSHVTGETYLGVQVGADPEMTPRQRLVSVAYALRSIKAADANTLDDMDSADFVAVAGDTMTGQLVLPTDGLVAGTNQLVLTGGKVGIGTTNPTAPLHIYTSGNYMIKAQTSGTYDFIFSVVPGSNKDFILNNNGAGGGIALSIANSKKLVVANDGNIGIGTTSPSEKLSVSGTVESSSGGYKFPDGSIQTTAAPTEQVSFCVKRDAYYDWPSNHTVQKIDFSSDSSVWYDTGLDFNTSTSQFIAPASGVYTFHGAISFERQSEGDLIYAYIKAGGKNYNGTWTHAGDSTEIVTVSITVPLIAGQTVSLWGYVNASSPPARVYGNTNPDFSFTYFMGARVS